MRDLASYYMWRYCMLGFLLCLLALVIFDAFMSPPHTTHVYTPQQLCQQHGGTWQVASNTCRVTS